MARKTISIPVVMDEEGRWAAYATHRIAQSEDTADWEWMEEMIDHEKPLAQNRRVWVTVEIEIPETVFVTTDVVRADA